MKKTIFLALTAIIGLCACNKSNNSTENEANATTSILAEQQRYEDSIAKARQDSIDFMNFTSADLKTYCLHGHVKEVVETKTDDFGSKAITYSFNRNGELISLTGYTKIERNANGQIKRFDLAPEESEEITWFWKYTYDSEGHLIKLSLDNDSKEPLVGDSDDFTYSKFDKNGWPLIETEGLCDGWVKYNNSYSELDDNGNWLKKHSAGFGEAGMEGFNRYDTTRKITYYTKEELKQTNFKVKI